MEPLLTYCDDATGERTELSASELGRWAARTAGLLRDGCRLAAGDRAAVLLPPHWQTAAVLLGAWSVGVAVSFRPWATAGLAVAEPCDAVFVSQQRLNSWLEEIPEATHKYVLGLGPHGAPLDEVPIGYLDYPSEVQRFPDDPPNYHTIGLSDPASPDGTTYRQWGDMAHDIAERMGLRPGDRVLVDVTQHEQPLSWLLAPMAAGASILLCANLDPATLDTRIATEAITHVL